VHYLASKLLAKIELCPGYWSWEEFLLGAVSVLMFSFPFTGVLRTTPDELEVADVVIVEAAALASALSEDPIVK